MANEKPYHDKSRSRYFFKKFANSFELAYFCKKITKQAMLIQFSISNYRSIGDEQIISLVPSAKQKDYPSNVISAGKYDALNAVAFYGANASGKSNLLKGIEMLDGLLNTSSQLNSTAKLPYSPFKLREGYDSLPTKFEIIFIIENNRYRFGLEYNSESVVTEWLYRKGSGREVCLYERRNDVIEVSSGFKASSKSIDLAIETTKDNSIFLSSCDRVNIDEAKSIFKWFGKIIYVNGYDAPQEIFTTIKLWEQPEYRIRIKNYMSLLNLGFVDLDVETKEFEANMIPKNVTESVRNMLIETFSKEKMYRPITSHRAYNAKGEKSGSTVSWALDENESEGTKKAFRLSGPVLKSLIDGGVLVIDEIESKMHPMMTLNTLNLFLNKDTNPLNAQIIFATHDTNLLTYSKLRRDQISFVEKNAWESTEIYSLSDIRYFNEKNQSERIDADKEKRYLEGRYGAIPMLGSFTTKMDKWYGEKR